MSARTFKLVAAIAMLSFTVGCGNKSVAMTSAEAPEAKLTLPKSGIVTVAFVISDGATLIDDAGPMQTFEQAQSPGTTGFKSFTVSATRSPIKAGELTVIPDYTFDDAPDADIVVVGAQSGRPSREPYRAYLRRMAARGRLMLSVCTGVSLFADAGLLDGLEATSHHDFIDRLQKDFPKVRWIRDRAYVHSAPMIYTAGGETSGFELALHIIELYWNHDVAVKTARSMEYRGPAWQS